MKHTNKLKKGENTRKTGKTIAKGNTLKVEGKWGEKMRNAKYHNTFRNYMKGK